MGGSVRGAMASARSRRSMARSHMAWASASRKCSEERRPLPMVLRWILAAAAERDEPAAIAAMTWSWMGDSCGDQRSVHSDLSLGVGVRRMVAGWL
jgi:hypothetical protein